MLAFESEADRLESFGRAIDSIRKSVEARVGDEDLVRVRRLRRASRALEIAGRSAIHFSFEPVTFGAGVVLLCSPSRQYQRRGEGPRHSLWSDSPDRAHAVARASSFPDPVRARRPFSRVRLPHESALHRRARLLVWQSGRGAWYARQAEATNNFEVPYALSVLCGGLDLQIEHHLFSKLGPERLREIAPAVREACAEHGVEYRSASWPKTLKSVFAHLKNLSFREALAEMT